jgi:hypothetical protein
MSGAVAETTAPILDAGPSLEEVERTGLGGQAGLGGRDGNDILEGALLGEGDDGAAGDGSDSSDDEGDGINVVATRDGGGAQHVRRTFDRGANVYVRPELAAAGGEGEAGEAVEETAEDAELKPLRYKYYKSSFDVVLSELETHPWRKPYTDLSDYFNYGFNEQSWNPYCAKQLKNRMESNEGPRLNESLAQEEDPASAVAVTGVVGTGANAALFGLPPAPAAPMAAALPASLAGVTPAAPAPVAGWGMPPPHSAMPAMPRPPNKREREEQVGEVDFGRDRDRDHHADRNNDRYNGGGGGGGGGYAGGGGGGVCFAFQKGQCTRGDSCRYRHEGEGGGGGGGSGSGGYYGNR